MRSRVNVNQMLMDKPFAVFRIGTSFDEFSLGDHVTRYVLSKEYADIDTVLDTGCGMGHGDG